MSPKAQPIKWDVFRVATWIGVFAACGPVCVWAVHMYDLPDRFTVYVQDQKVINEKINYKLSLLMMKEHIPDTSYTNQNSMFSDLTIH